MISIDFYSLCHYKKFKISKAASGARFRDYLGRIEWLDDAGMVNICYCLNFPELPLKGNYDETKYKIYFADSGLLGAMLGEETREDLRTNKNLSVYKGALYENIVGEALVKAGYNLYYYKRNDSTLEQDFLVRTVNSLIPMEVKARNGTAKSLRTLISSEKYPDICCGIKFTDGNAGFSDSICDSSNVIINNRRQIRFPLRRNFTFLSSPILYFTIPY